MMFVLPTHNTVVMQGESAKLRATEMIRGHLGAAESNRVLFIGNEPFEELGNSANDARIAYAATASNTQRYTLVVVYQRAQSNFNNGVFSIELEEDLVTKLTQMHLDLLSNFVGVLD